VRLKVIHVIKSHILKFLENTLAVIKIEFSNLSTGKQVRRCKTFRFSARTFFWCELFYSLSNFRLGTFGCYYSVCFNKGGWALYKCKLHYF